MFPVAEVRAKVVSLLEENLPPVLQHRAQAILNLHMHPSNFVMTCMTQEECHHLIHLLESNSCEEDVQRAIKFENVATLAGRLRVLVRTHLNRSGINHISQGYWEKTLSPRILNFTDSLSLDVDLAAIQNTLPVRWLEFAQMHQDGTDKSRYHDARALRTLGTLCSRQDELFRFIETSPGKPSAPKLVQKFGTSNIDLGWCRIMLGVMSGLKFLKETHTDVLRIISRDTLAYKEIHQLTKDCQNNISEYGYALAASFLADMGSAFFVKDDTHVRDCMSALYPGMRTAESRVERVIHEANLIGLTPRALDKLMYLPCSGNLYLLGLKLQNAPQMKASLLRYLATFAEKV